MRRTQAPSLALGVSHRDCASSGGWYGYLRPQEGSRMAFSAAWARNGRSFTTASDSPCNEPDSLRLSVAVRLPITSTSLPSACTIAPISASLASAHASSCLAHSRWEVASRRWFRHTSLLGAKAMDLNSVTIRHAALKLGREAQTLSFALSTSLASSGEETITRGREPSHTVKMGPYCSDSCLKVR